MELEQIINCKTGEIVNVNKDTQEVVEVIQAAHELAQEAE